MIKNDKQITEGSKGRQVKGAGGAYVRQAGTWVVTGSEERGTPTHGEGSV